MKLSFWLCFSVAGLALAVMLAFKLKTIEVIPTAEAEISATPAPVAGDSNLPLPQAAETNKTSENLRQQMERLGFNPDSFHRVVVKEK